LDIVLVLVVVPPALRSENPPLPVVKRDLGSGESGALMVFSEFVLGFGGGAAVYREV
jgi:hypothetical protein